MPTHNHEILGDKKLRLFTPCETCTHLSAGTLRNEPSRGTDGECLHRGICWLQQQRQQCGATPSKAVPHKSKLKHDPGAKVQGKGMGLGASIFRPCDRSSITDRQIWHVYLFHSLLRVSSCSTENNVPYNLRRTPILQQPMPMVPERTYDRSLPSDSLCLLH